jgi:NTP pyrophosphatase (non-canonical NTP hydrolase)
MPIATTNYPIFVKTLCKDGEAIRAVLTADDCHALHMAMSVAGEAGELLDAIKRLTIYRKPLDAKLRANVIEELGDLEFYMEGLRQAFGITRESTLRQNMEKLEERYAHATYTDEAAIARRDKQQPHKGFEGFPLVVSAPPGPTPGLADCPVELPKCLKSTGAGQMAFCQLPLGHAGHCASEL